MSAPLQGTASAALEIARVRYTHDAMIDLVISRPGISQNEIARYFGYTVGWISRVFNSDAFQARLADRKGDLIDPTIMQSFDDRLKGLANQSLDILMDKLDATKSSDIALKALELTTKALGMGARDRQPVIQQTFVVALPPKAATQEAWIETAEGTAARRAGFGVRNQQISDVPMTAVVMDLMQPEVPVPQA